MKQTIADKIKTLAKLPHVVENRRKLRAMYYIAKVNSKTHFARLRNHLFQSVSSFSGTAKIVDGWVVTLREEGTCDDQPWGQDIDKVFLFPMSSYDSNGDKPLVRP